jgi:SAM-dependent methyltransferase
MMLSALEPTRVSLETVDCPICVNQTSKVWLEDGKPTRYMRCPGCGTVYLSPRLSERIRFTGFEEKYNDRSNTQALAEARRPALQSEAQFLQKIKSTGKLLDIGCNTGMLFEYFDRASWERYGVEVAEAAAVVARQADAAHIHVGTLSSADYPDHFFDLVTMIDMFYYVGQPREELDEIHRVLGEDGILAIEIPGQAYLLNRSRGLLCYLLDGRWTRFQTDSTYLYWYSPVGLERLLQRSGFLVSDWFVINSSEQSGLSRVLASGYTNMIRWLSRGSLRYLTWSPKILCVAQLNHEG